MISINQNNEKIKRYLPHELKTRENAVKTYRNGNSISYVCRKYHISRTSLYRWNKKYDGTKESLIDESHKPKSNHPNAHTDSEIKHIKDLIKRNPNITLCELWYKLRTKYSYSRHIGSLYRILRNLLEKYRYFGTALVDQEKIIERNVQPEDRIFLRSISTKKDKQHRDCI